MTISTFTFVSTHSSYMIIKKFGKFVIEINAFLLGVSGHG